MRVGGSLSACCWTPDGTAICAVGSRGAYLFAFYPKETTR
jgi:hypothetical protein